MRGHDPPDRRHSDSEAACKSCRPANAAVRDSHVIAQSMVAVPRVLNRFYQVVKVSLDLLIAINLAYAFLA